MKSPVEMREIVDLDLHVANRYLHGQIDFDEASDLLLDTGLHGRLTLGELAIEEAQHYTDGSAKGYLDFSEALLHEVVIESPRGSDNALLGYDLRAKMRLTQFEAIRSLVTNGRLPDKDTSQRMYEQLVELSNTMLDQYPRLAKGGNDTLRISKGRITEIIVLALTQRYALNEDFADQWLPLQSYFSEDHGGDCLSVITNSAWDISIFTQYDPSDPLELTYRIQVKAHLDQEVPDKGGISTVGVSPHLRLHHNENDQQIIIRTLRSMALELEQPHECQRLTTDLNCRTSRILSIID